MLHPLKEYAPRATLKILRRGIPRAALACSSGRTKQFIWAPRGTTWSRPAVFPIVGRPDFVQSFMDGGGVPLSHLIFEAASYCRAAYGRSFKRQSGADPISIASAEAGAVVADQEDFHVVDEWGKPECPLAIPTPRCTTHPNDGFATIRMQTNNEEIGSARMQAEKPPTTRMARNACLRLFANPLCARFLGSFVHGVSLDFRHPCILMHASDFVAWATKALGWPEVIAMPSDEF